MPDNPIVDIVKKAIIMEQRGRALYRKAAEETDNEAAKELFIMLAEEEEDHVATLSRQYTSVIKGGNFVTDDLAPEEDSGSVLTEEIVKGISAAGFESAVISAALEFEKRAVEFYAKQAEAAETDEQKKVFRWLTDWEKGHMDMLARLDRELMESIWHDNNFWPLD